MASKIPISNPNSPPVSKALALKVEYRPLTSLRLNPRNPRLHSQKQVRQLSNSIETFGFVVPILVDTDLMVIAGHGRVMASRLLGIDEVPTIRLDHLSPEQIATLLIADNRLSENAEWDDTLLAEQLKVLSEAELSFSLEVTGFDVPEIDILIEGLQPGTEGAVDPADSVPETPQRIASRLGDCWLLGKHRLLCGNSLETNCYKALMQNTKADMVITDPPFNVRISGHVGGLGKIQHSEFPMASGEMTPQEFTQFLASACRQMATHSKEGSIHYVFIDWRHVGELLEATKDVYSKFENLCIWVKSNGGMGSFYRSQHELIGVFQNGAGPHRNNVQLGKHGRYRTNVWEYPGVNTFARQTEEGNLLELHPTVKPVALISDAILDCTARGEIVLDPFLGSGTTVIAAERVGRVCYGIELEPKYVDVAVQRWQNFTGKAAIHSRTGKTFAQAQEEISSVG